AALSSASGRRSGSSVAATSAPAAARPSASARPIPGPQPVTRATLPSTRRLGRIIATTSPRQQPAVDGERAARDVRRLVRGQEERRLRHLLGRTPAALWLHLVRH